MTDPVPDPGAGRPAYLTEHLLRGLRVAQSVIVLAILLGLVLPNVLGTLDLYAHPVTGLVWWGALLAVAVANAALVARHRFWGPVRWPVAAGVLAVAWGAGAALPPEALVGPAHQTLGLVGWFGVLLFCDLALGWTVGFVGAHVLLVLAQLGLAGRADRATLVDLTVVVVATAGFQLAVGCASSALRRVARLATASARRQAETVTAELVARQVHRDRESRYARLREDVLPLLRGIADGTRPPSDPGVQRRAALEAARMRRLFAEDHDTACPLAAELTALVDVVERRGVDVRFSAREPRPRPPTDVARRLVEELGPVLLAARREARVTLGGVDGELVVSVVADAGAAGPGGERDAPRGRERDGIRTTTVADGGSTWVEARWTPVATGRSRGRPPGRPPERSRS